MIICAKEILENDWDGYGADAISEEVIASANKLINKLQIEDVSWSPCTDDEIIFEWSLNDQKLCIFIEIDEKLRIMYKHNGFINFYEYSNKKYFIKCNEKTAHWQCMIADDIKFIKCLINKFKKEV